MSFRNAQGENPNFEIKRELRVYAFTLATKINQHFITPENKLSIEEKAARDQLITNVRESPDKSPKAMIKTLENIFNNLPEVKELEFIFPDDDRYKKGITKNPTAKDVKMNEDLIETRKILYKSIMEMVEIYKFKQDIYEKVSKLFPDPGKAGANADIMKSVYSLSNVDKDKVRDGVNGIIYSYDRGKQTAAVLDLLREHRDTTLQILVNEKPYFKSK